MALPAVGLLTMSSDDLDRMEALAGAADDIMQLSSGPEDGQHPAAVQQPAQEVEVIGSDSDPALLGFNADPLDRIAELALIRQPPAAPVFRQRGPELMRFARAGLAKRRHEERTARLRAHGAALDAHLQRFSRLFPEAARVAGLKRKRPVGNSKDMDTDRASMLVNAAFQAKPPRAIGVKFTRLLLFACRLTLELQVRGLLALLMACARFRQAPTPGCAHTVHLGLVHESDATAQQLAQMAMQTVGRAARKPMSTEVFNQQGVLRALLQRKDLATGAVVESRMVESRWLSMSCAMMGKTAPFILRGLELGMPFSTGEPAQWAQWAALLRAGADVVTVDLYGDQGSNNGPAFKHVAQKFANEAGALVDISPCEVHVAQGVKVGIPGCKQMPGKLYSLSSVYRVASTHNALVNCLEYICHTTVFRVVGRPPPEAMQGQRLLAALYDTEAEHHERSTGAKSSFWEDVELLGRMTTVPPETPQVGHLAARVHWCWDPETGRACCENLEATREKTVVAMVNFFAARSFDQVSLSRFTHMAKARKKQFLLHAANRGSDRRDPRPAAICLLRKGWGGRHSGRVLRQTPFASGIGVAESLERARRLGGRPRGPMEDIGAFRLDRLRGPRDNAACEGGLVEFCQRRVFSL